MPKFHFAKDDWSQDEEANKQKNFEENRVKVLFMTQSFKRV